MPTKSKPEVLFVHDGKPMPAVNNRLSSVAYFCTAGIKKGKDRIGAKELRDLLKKLGVDDPSVPGWKATLPNGVKLEGRKNTAAASKPKATKKTTKKATPKKRAA